MVGGHQQLWWRNYCSVGSANNRQNRLQHPLAIDAHKPPEEKHSVENNQPILSHILVWYQKCMWETSFSFSSSN